jgi:AcrR family transcriptional regulator
MYEFTVILSVQCMVSTAASRTVPRTHRAIEARERIVTTALALIEKKGLEAFSTRRLASRLGLQVMSLYHYFPSREALLDAAVDRMIAEVPLPDVAQVEWREGLLGLARDYRAMGHRHLRAIPLLAQRCPAFPAMQRFLDTLSGLLLKAGLKPLVASDWLVIQRDYVIGSLMADHSAYLLVTESARRSRRVAGDHPGKLPPELARGMRETAFEKGLKAMLDAIERER